MPQFRRRPPSARTRACGQRVQEIRQVFFRRNAMCDGKSEQFVRRGKAATDQIPALIAHKTRPPAVRIQRTIFRRVPTVSALPRSLFKLLILATEVSNSCAMEKSV